MSVNESKAVSKASKSTGGRDEEIVMPLPPGISDDGEIFDPDAYEQYAAKSETQEATRREEVNINHARHEHDKDDDGGYLL